MLLGVYSEWRRSHTGTSSPPDYVDFPRMTWTQGEDKILVVLRFGLPIIP